MHTPRCIDAVAVAARASLRCAPCYPVCASPDCRSPTRRTSRSTIQSGNYEKSEARYATTKTSLNGSTSIPPLRSVLPGLRIPRLPYPDAPNKLLHHPVWQLRKGRSPLCNYENLNERQLEHPCAALRSVLPGLRIPRLP